jgi:hypothetical protein
MRVLCILLVTVAILIAIPIIVVQAVGTRNYRRVLNSPIAPAVVRGRRAQRLMATIA